MRSEKNSEGKGVSLSSFLFFYRSLTSLPRTPLSERPEQATETRPTTEVACLRLSSSGNGRQKGSERGKRGGEKIRVFPE